MRGVACLSHAASGIIGLRRGEQSDHPGGPLYSDLKEPWAKGEYLSLHAVGSPDRLAGSARTRKLSFVKP
jgi:acyl-homoserine lactone acylase PvdQ